MAKSVTKSIVCQPAAETGVISMLIPLRMFSVFKSAKNILFSLCVRTGKEVLPALMEQERTNLYGPKGQPNPEWQAVRGDHTMSHLTLGGQRIEVRRLLRNPPLRSRHCP